MEPNSALLLVLLAVVVLALVWCVLRLSRVVVRVACAVLLVAVSALGGMVIVNDYYGYYRTWSQLTADLNGNYSAFTATNVPRRAAQTGHGVLETIYLTGARSHIDRHGLVYLPPQYFEKQYATTTFPVLELVHGSPGGPNSWVVQLNIAGVMNTLIAHRQIGPMIVVMPAMNPSHGFQEGVDASGALDDTYLTYDVRADVVAHLRASTVGAEWGIGGYSSGGYAAINLALRHRDQFGAVGAMDGYFRPQDGPAAAALHGDARAEAANNPLLVASHLGAGATPMPAVWLSAGTGNSADLAGAVALAKALDGVEQVSLNKAVGGGHNFYDWSGSLPHLVAWMWTQLAPPQLRAAFPITGPVRQGALFPPPYPHSSSRHRVRASTPEPRSPASSSPSSPVDTLSPDDHQ